MARNEVTIDLNLRGEQQVKRGLKDVGDAADKAGNEFSGMAKDAGVLTKKISETETQVKKLVKQFDETGDMDLLKSIRKEQSNLRLFERLRKSIADEARDVGSDAGQKIGEGLTLSLRSLRGPAIVGAIGLGALLAPAIGVAIQGAVIGGAGVGGIVGGIVAASQDQQVQMAAKLVGDHVGDELLRAGSAWVAPTIESLNILDAAGSKLADNFAKIGEKLGPVLPGLTGGAAGALDNIVGGITRAADAMQPAIRALSTELPKIGAAVGDFFDTISEDSDQAVLGIVATSQAIQGTITTAGDLLATLGDLFEWSSRSGAAISGTMETLFGWLPVAGDAIKNQGQNFRDQVAAVDAAHDASKDYVDGGLQPIIRAEEEIEEATKTATEAIEGQIKAMDKAFHRAMDPKELASNYQEAIDELTKSVEKNGKTLDIRTEQGRANEAQLRAQADAIFAIAKDMFNKTGDIAATDAAFSQMVETLRRQAYQLGLNKAQVDAFIATLKAVEGQWDVEVRAPGLLEAIDRAQYLNRLMGSISAGARSRAGDTSGYGGGRAGGGPMSPGKWYTVGENGIEVVAMHPGGGATVFNDKQTGAMMSGASGGSSVAGWGGGGTQTLVIRVESAGGDWNDMVARSIRAQVADIGGGSVQRTYGRDDR